MDQTLDQLGGARFLSVVDTSRGFYQVGLKKEDRHKTRIIPRFLLIINNDSGRRCVSGYAMHHQRSRG